VIDEPTAAPKEQQEGKRRWPMVALVIAGIAVAGFVGFLLGGNSRDDDVSSAKASADQALEQDQAQDQKAMEQVQQGFEDLGDAIAQEEANDDQAAQDAVDQATQEIQNGLGKLKTDVSENLDAALSELSTKINEAVGSAGGDEATQ
jgi:F0F1-type ATP synthase membrane subunit b/b'